MSKLWRKLVWRTLLYAVLGISLALATHEGIVTFKQSYRGAMPDWVRQLIWLLAVVVQWVLFAVLVMKPYGELKAAQKTQKNAQAG